MRRTKPAGVLEHQPVPVRAKLAAAWTSFMLLYVYVDILGLYLPGVIDDILAGVVWELEITQTWAVGALVLMAIPILMVVLATILPARSNRVTNLAVATIYILVSAANAIGESWTTYFAVAAATRGQRPRTDHPYRLDVAPQPPPEHRRRRQRPPPHGAGVVTSPHDGLFEVRLRIHLLARGFHRGDLTTAPAAHPTNVAVAS